MTNSLKEFTSLINPFKQSGAPPFMQAQLVLPHAQLDKHVKSKQECKTDQLLQASEAGLGLHGDKGRGGHGKSADSVEADCTCRGFTSRPQTARRSGLVSSVLAQAVVG